MKWIFCALGIFGIPTFIEVLRYNVHMFQLNGYKNAEHMSWLKKNYKKQMLLFVNVLCSVLVLIKSNYFTILLFCIVAIIVYKNYCFLKKSSAKKKLVYTNRVKRLIATNIVIVCLLVIFMCRFLGIDKTAGIIGVLMFLQPVCLMMVNVVNAPIEKGVNNYYIFDAKKKLEQMPGLTVIGVTGSYGKTSIKYFLYTLLREKYDVLITPESYNTPMGVVKTIREFLRPTHEVFICEMGARHVGDIKEICDIVYPKHGIITSVGPQHLETFYNIENIIKTKFELADALPADGMLFLNGDNRYIQENAEEYPNRVFYRTQLKKGDYYAENIKVSHLGTEFSVVAPNGEKESYQLRLIGEHNVINVIGAIAVANMLGIPLKDLKVPVRKIQPVEHRMQIIRKGNVTIIDDAYNSNPIGSKAAVETLAMFDGIKILITPGMVELGKEEEVFNYKFGEYAAKCCDYILLVGKKHTQPIERGALDSGFAKERCKAYNKLEEALEYAYSIKSSEHKYILLENDLPDNY